MPCCQRLTLFFFLVCCSWASVAQTLFVRPAQSEHDISHSFFVSLLEQSLKKSGAYQIEVLKVEDLTQDRGFLLLKQHRLDVFWAGINPVRADNFRVITVPLTMGMLGHRLPVIRRQDKAKFDALDEVELKKLRACQGSQWPDSDILEHNGYRVVRAPKFAMMYDMLSVGRCHYFPRGLNEVYGEVSSFEQSGGADDLIVYDKIVLKYRFPMLFFTHKDNEALAQKIDAGLRKMVESGELMQFIKSHPVTRDAFPLERFAESRIYELVNPLLTVPLPEDNHYWIHL
ncbi:hypothetical protein [Litoribrevibacter albus]|uniref:hypothetical protein n=1 Tax=Litoribrevibacter albus TaxID=1473156 RepID=UPI0024E13943|nr:hypothetical protein [Litoribrevibacter albus]